MTREISGARFALTAGVALIGRGLVSLLASAGNPDKNWNRGCVDAKEGSYDRAHPSPAYERGWQSCKQN
jgi:hypothetical protein